MSDLNTTTSITIDASVEDVWKALTTPELIKQWFFGVDTETDWQVGSPLVHRGEYQGKPYQDKGEIVRFDPPSSWCTPIGATSPASRTAPSTTRR